MIDHPQHGPDSGVHGRRLAEREQFRVDLCGCGMLHVAMGPVTVRLQPLAFEAFAHTLVEALPGLPLARPESTH